MRRRWARWFESRTSGSRRPRTLGGKETVMSCRVILWSATLAVLCLAMCAGSARVLTASTPSAHQGSAASCPVTEQVRATPPADPNASPFGDGPWFVNADRSIWTAGDWTSGAKGTKALWIRPQGTNLVVTGHRIDDGDSRPLAIDIPCCYRTGFQATRVYFPTAGCWELSATAGTSKFTFVVRVREG